MITIVYSHPYEKSFNHFILQSLVKQLDELGREYQVIDLYHDGFEPAIEAADLALFSKGETTDPLVKQYQQMVMRTDHIVFLFPIWWGMMPAMLKGFIDKVFLKGMFYDTTPEGAMLPNLSIDRTTVITTSQNDSAVFAPFIEGYFVPLVLNTVGINNVKWHNCQHIGTITDTDRQLFVEEIMKEFAQ